ILTMLEDENVSAVKLEAIISNDQAIASKVLSIANSAYYSLSEKVTSISHAVSLLGFTTVKNIAIGTSIFSNFSDKGSGIEMKDLWLHSIGVAMASEKIARKVSGIQPDTAFIGGLLHDIGKLTMIDIFQERYKDAVDVARDTACSICFAEDRVFGTNHITVGEWLCERWHLPPEVILSVKYHRSPWLAAENKELPSVVYLGNNIIKREKIGFAGDNYTPRIDERVLKTLNLTEVSLSELYSFVRAEKGNIVNILTIGE
ncbi:MAG: HDOD domain-containing protein, partial [Nitrospinae bacterium]|nr:HDOD domain-containing protein [Nitrospinota bacterium]